MPQTVCSGIMFTTPTGFSPHLACVEPEEEEEEAPQEGPEPGACLSDGPMITSASLDTLIQNLVPTADYYPEVISAHLFMETLTAALPIRLLSLPLITEICCVYYQLCVDAVANVSFFFCPDRKPMCLPSC